MVHHRLTCGLFIISARFLRATPCGFGRDNGDWTGGSTGLLLWGCSSGHFGWRRNAMIPSWESSIADSIILSFACCANGGKPWLTRIMQAVERLSALNKFKPSLISFPVTKAQPHLCVVLTCYRKRADLDCAVG